MDLKSILMLKAYQFTPYAPIRPPLAMWISKCFLNECEDLLDLKILYLIVI